MDTEIKEMIPREPFVEWLERKSVEYGGWIQLQEVLGISDRQLRAIRDGRKVEPEGERIITHVPLDLVDQALIREGSTDLWELAPGLYD